MSMPAGWYPDPFSSSGYLRWWDGQRWGPSQVAGERPPGLAPDEPTPMPPPPTSGSVTGPESGIAFASWGSRAVARIIDSLIEGLLAAPFLVILLREPFDHLMSALRALPAGTTQVPAAVMNDFVSSVTGKTLAVTLISVIVSLLTCSGMGMSLAKLSHDDQQAQKSIRRGQPPMTNPDSASMVPSLESFK